MVWSRVTWRRMALIREGNTMRKALWLAVPIALGAVIAGGWQDIIRFAKIKQISLGSGHPEVVPAEGKHSYGNARPSGEPDFDSAFRGGPAQLVR
jgi:hypothetical protein